MRTYDDVRLECRACGIDLLEGEWLHGVCLRCEKVVRALIEQSKAGAYSLVRGRLDG